MEPKTDPIENLTIRAARIEDAEAITALSALPRYRWGTLRPPFPAVSETRTWLETRAPGDLHLVATLSEQVIGTAGLRRLPGRRGHCADIGMGVHDDFRGQGVGTALTAAIVDAADQWLAIDRLELTVYVDNTPANALYAKFDFEIEGTLKRFAFRDGVYVDAYCMARLRTP